MLAHSGESADLGNDLLKVSDVPIMMTYNNEPGYNNSTSSFNPEQHHYYHHHQQQQQQQHYEQAFHHQQYHNGPPTPHQHQDYFHHQQQHQQHQMMYCPPSQAMQGYSYQPGQIDYNGGYYHHHQQQPPSAPQQIGYPFQANQSVMVNNGPPSHGSQNCTPSPHANSDDSGGDCVNEPKLHQLGMPPHFSGPETTPPIPPYVSDLGLNGKPPCIPVSVMARSVTAARRGKKSKHRDPNEPQKPVSAYALFFRDMQAGIKARNPNSSFGEVSKHVASMWDGLDPDHKAIYKRRTETAKKEYLKRLAAYRASLVSKGAADPVSPQDPEFGGPRFIPGYESGSLVPKDLGSITSPLYPPRHLGSPPNSSQMLPSIPDDRSPAAVKPSPISSAPPAYSTTTTTASTTSSSSSTSTYPNPMMTSNMQWNQSRQNMMLGPQKQLQQQPQQQQQLQQQLLQHQPSSQQQHAPQQQQQQRPQQYS